MRRTHMPKLPSVKAKRNTSPEAPFFAGNACMHVIYASIFINSPPQSPVGVHLHTVLSSLEDSTSPEALHAMPVTNSLC